MAFVLCGSAGSAVGLLSAKHTRARRPGPSLGAAHGLATIGYVARYASKWLTLCAAGAPLSVCYRGQACTKAAMLHGTLALQQSG